MKRGTSYLIAALLIWGFAVQSARAGLVTIGFTAEVTYLDDPYSVFEGGIDVGDTITGTYIYDTSTPDLIPNPWIALYEHTCSACGISLEVGEFEIKTDPSNVEFVVSIGNDIADLTGYAWDSFELKSENNLPLYDLQ